MSTQAGEDESKAGGQEWTVKTIRKSALDHHHQECWNRAGSKAFGFCHWIATMLKVCSTQSSIPTQLANADEALLIYRLTEALKRSKTVKGRDGQTYAPTFSMIGSIQPVVDKAVLNDTTHDHSWASAEKDNQNIITVYAKVNPKAVNTILEAKKSIQPGLRIASQFGQWKSLVNRIDPLEGTKQEQLETLEKWQEAVPGEAGKILALIKKLKAAIEKRNDNLAKRYITLFKAKKFWYACKFDRLEDKDLAEIIIYSSVQRENTDDLNAKLKKVYFNTTKRAQKGDRFLKVANKYLPKPTKKNPDKFLEPTEKYGTHMEALGFVMLRRLAWVVYRTDNLWVQPLKHGGQGSDIVMATTLDMMLPTRRYTQLSDFLDVIFAPQDLGHNTQRKQSIAEKIADNYGITMDTASKEQQLAWKELYPTYPNLLNAVFYDTKWSVWNKSGSEGSSRWIVEMDSVQHAPEEAMGTDRSFPCGKRQLFAANNGLFDYTDWNFLFNTLSDTDLNEDAILLLGEAVGITKDTLKAARKPVGQASLFWASNRIPISNTSIYQGFATDAKAALVAASAASDEAHEEAAANKKEADLNQQAANEAAIRERSISPAATAAAQQDEALRSARSVFPRERRSTDQTRGSPDPTMRRIGFGRMSINSELQIGRLQKNKLQQFVPAFSNLQIKF